MRLEHYDQEKLKQEILILLGEHLDLARHKVFFFGSRVAGGGDEHSDIDVGIEGPESLSLDVMLDIQEALENLSTLYKVEVVDFYRAGERFETNAKQHIELINR